MSIQSSTNTAGKLEPYLILRVAIAAILLTATVLKIHKLATQPSANTNLLNYRWTEMLTAQMQIILTAWLLSGLWARLAWAATLACFCGFVGVTFYLAVTGHASCGCFGTVEVNPWITLVLDAAIVAALCIFRPRPRSPLTPRSLHRRAGLTLAAILAAAIPAAALPMAYTPAKLLPDGTIEGRDRTVVLDPADWTGKPLPLLSHIDIGTELAQHRWTVLLYHNDCTLCREVIPQFDALARRRAARGLPPAIALIELPPYGPPETSPIPPNTLCASGRLANDHDWFVPTPVVLTLDAGTVTSVEVQRATVDGPVSQGDQPISEKIVPVATTEAVCDFGTVQAGSTHYVTFAIRSPVGRTLAIRRIISECPCLTVPNPPEKLTQSATMVQVRFEAPKTPEPYTTRLVIFTHGPQAPTLILRIQANVH